MKIKADIVILLPARNEAAAIGKVIDDIRNISNDQYEIVVTASGCTDQTEMIAQKHGAQVIHAPKGKGAAVQFALKQIEANKILMLDSDGTYPVHNIPDMLAKLDKYDAVMGCRHLIPFNSQWLGRQGNRFITFQARALYGIPIHDLCTGMWAFRGTTIQALDIKSKGFTLEAELFVYLVKNHFTIGQIPITYHPRIGNSKINRLDHLKIMAYLWSRRFN